MVADSMSTTLIGKVDEVSVDLLLLITIDYQLPITIFTITCQKTDEIVTSCLYVQEVAVHEMTRSSQRVTSKATRKMVSGSTSSSSSSSEEIFHQTVGYSSFYIRLYIRYLPYLLATSLLCCEVISLFKGAAANSWR